METTNIQCSKTVFKHPLMWFGFFVFFFFKISTANKKNQVKTTTEEKNEVGIEAQRKTVLFTFLLPIQPF